MSTMCAHMRLKDVKPTVRCSRASPSWPQACSNHGTRAMRNTWTSSRAEATRPVSRPVLVRRPAGVPIPVRPPPWTQSAVTHSSTAHSSAAEASRHQRGTVRGRL